MAYADGNDMLRVCADVSGSRMMKAGEWNDDIMKEGSSREMIYSVL